MSVPILTHPVVLGPPDVSLLETSTALEAFTDALYPAVVLVVLSTAVVGIFTGLAFFAAIVLVSVLLILLRAHY